MQTKKAITSKTLQGIVLFALSCLVQFLYRKNVISGDVSAFLSEYIAYLGEAAGIVWASYGRIATKGERLTL